MREAHEILLVLAGHEAAGDRAEHQHRHADQHEVDAHHHGLRTAFAQVTSLDLDRLTLLEGVRRSNINLDLFGRALADQQVVRLAHVLHDRLVHLVARHADRFPVDDAGE